MSAKSSRQSLILLAFINGVFITINEDDLLPDLSPTLLYGQDLARQVINGFPEQGSPKANTAWCDKKMKLVAEVVNQGDQNFTPIELVTIGQMIVVDLLEEVTDLKKRELFFELKEVLDKVSDAIDPGGTAFTVYESVDMTLAQVYSIIGFTKEGRWLKRLKKLERRKQQFKAEGLV